MIGLYITIIMIIIIIIMPWKIRFIYNDKKSNFDLCLKIFNFKFDIDKIIDRHKKSDKDDNVKTRDLIFRNLLFVRERKSLVTTLSKFVIVRKLTITCSVSSVIAGVLAWNSIYYIRNRVFELFLNCDNEYYNVKYNSESKNNIDFEIIFYIRICYVLYAYILNIKDLIKIKKKEVL